MGDQGDFIQTVTGPVTPGKFGLVDSHTHVWIEPGENIPPSQVLDQFEPIARELTHFRWAGGAALVDCQPGGCGRNGNALRELSARSGVYIVATTGFHLRRYYPVGHPVWHLTADDAAQVFGREIAERLAESEPTDENPIRAGVLKVGLDVGWDDQTRALMTGAAQASLATGAVIMFHTERGATAERLPLFFGNLGVKPTRLTVCHADKDPDIGFHRELAASGMLLSYETFLRPKYSPEQNVWPLLRAMVAEGYAGAITLGTDAAGPAYWRELGGQVSWTTLATSIMPRLKLEGFDAEAISCLTGGNLAERLAFQTEN